MENQLVKVNNKLMTAYSAYKLLDNRPISPATFRARVLRDMKRFDKDTYSIQELQEIANRKRLPSGWGRPKEKNWSRLKEAKDAGSYFDFNLWQPTSVSLK